MTAGARNDNPVRKVRLMGQSTQRCRLQHQLSNRQADTLPGAHDCRLSGAPVQRREEAIHGDPQSARSRR